MSVVKALAAIAAIVYVSWRVNKYRGEHYQSGTSGNRLSWGQGFKGAFLGASYPSPQTAGDTSVTKFVSGGMNISAGPSINPLAQPGVSVTFDKL